MEGIAIELSPNTPKYRQVEAILRRRIESGEFPIGYPLPSTTTMAQQIGVHPLTLQKALRRLKNDGLIDRTPRLGSFVRGPVGAPAIALLSGPSLSDEYTHFYRVLMRALQDDSSPQWLTRVYDGLAFSERGPSPDTRNTFPALQKDCGLIPFRGMIVSGLDKRPWKRIDSLSRLPCAWLGRVEDGADITFDYGDFARSAVAYFARRNRRHVAYLRTFGYLPWARHDIPAFKATASECGTERTEIHDLDALHRDACDEHATYESVQSILRGWSQTRWPDAILVSDDVVMRAVALALLNAEHPGARQVELVTWANDKVRFHYGIPTARYDVPVDYCAQRLKDILSQRMDGKTPENIPERIRGRIVESA